MTGAVDQINISSGGVPKLPIGRAVVNTRGIVDDHQADQKHHGRPHQALCLYSAEVIEALRAEGHPIEAGSTGENLTLSGLDWASLVPGTQLRIGEVLAEITAFTAPCAKNSRWFLDGNHERMSQELHPGWSRLYAAVLEGGVIEPGDLVTVV